jgi:deoxyribodipyrimidine photo-lyase
MKSVPAIRIGQANEAALNPGGDFVLYWMTAFRRVHWNYSLDRALEWAMEFDRPLVILEALRCGYDWASDRFHSFILDGMADNARRLKKSRALYYPYVEPRTDAGKGLLQALAAQACVVVTDAYPAFFIPRMIASAAGKIPVRLEQVDANGILPLRAADRVYPTAYAFRRFLQKTLPPHLHEAPKAVPMRGLQIKRLKSLPKKMIRRWPPASGALLKGREKSLSALPIDHGVRIVGAERGGRDQARDRLERFLGDRLALYAECRNEPETRCTSELSPYLHFGHLSSHEIFQRVVEEEDWFFDRLSGKSSGSRSGWWGMSGSSEAFLDQLITWRELGFNMCWQREDYDRYESLPDWALKTLRTHEMDARPYIYDGEAFEGAQTHDPLWNAAQIQLVREGRIHNYLRMLWGKKILHWSPTPRDALGTMIALNDKYALDGRDPNSYSGIFWVLGRYDRAWGPERPIFGKVRYMSSRNTARKVRVKAYVETYAPS